VHSGHVLIEEIFVAKCGFALKALERAETLMDGFDVLRPAQAECQCRVNNVSYINVVHRRAVGWF
jgi:hypothetical protein